IADDAAGHALDSLLCDQIRQFVHRRGRPPDKKFSGQCGITIASDVDVPTDRSVGPDWSIAKRINAMALVKSFIVEAGCISSPAFSAYRVSPRERETTMAPHIPLRVFAVSPLKMDATSAELFSTVYRTMGTAGGRF